jgi:hypothetical protein
MQGHFFGHAMSGADITREFMQLPQLKVADL